MQKEIEAKFTGVNIDEIRAKLELAGAALVHPMRQMKRVTIDTPDMKKKDAFLRVRDEGDKVTATYKQFDSLSVDGVKEVEITVSDFDATVALLTAAGLPHRSFQESKRETWQLDSAEVVIDEWPWLKPYIEIEAPDETTVMAVARQLGFDKNEAVFGDVMAAYRVQYPHLGPRDTIGNIPNVRFGDPLPTLLKSSS